MYTATFLLLATTTLVFAGPDYKQKPGYKKHFSSSSDVIGSGPILRRRFSSASLGSRGIDADFDTVDFGSEGFTSAGSHVDVLGSGAPYYKGSDIHRKYKPIIGIGGRVSGAGRKIRGAGRIVTDIGRPYHETSYPLPVDLEDGIGNGPYPVDDTSYPVPSGYGDVLPISYTDGAVVSAGVSSTSSAGLSARDVIVKRKKPIAISPYQRRHNPAIVDVGAADSILSGVGGAVDVIGSSRRNNYFKRDYYDRKEPRVISPYSVPSGPAIVGAADSVLSGVRGAVDVIGSSRGKNYFKSNYADTKAYGHPKKPYGYQNQKGFGRSRGLRSSRLSLGVPSAVSRRSLIDFGDSGNFVGGTSFVASGRGPGRSVGSVVDYESIGKGSGTYYSNGRRHISQYVNGLDYGLSRDDIHFILKSKAFPSNMHIPKRRHIKW